MSTLKDLDELLDEEMDLLRRKLELLDGMSDCVRRGFYQELEVLLEEASDLEARSGELTQRIGETCQSLAASRGQEIEEATVRSLLESTEGPETMALRDKRERMVVLVRKVREGGAALGILVEEVLDINQRLLAAVIGDEEWVDTYGEDGGIDRTPEGLSFEQNA